MLKQGKSVIIKAIACGNIYHVLMYFETFAYVLI